MSLLAVPVSLSLLLSLLVSVSVSVVLQCRPGSTAFGGLVDCGKVQKRVLFPFDSLQVYLFHESVRGAFGPLFVT